MATPEFVRSTAGATAPCSRTAALEYLEPLAAGDRGHELRLSVSLSMVAPMAMASAAVTRTATGHIGSGWSVALRGFLPGPALAPSSVWSHPGDRVDEPTLRDDFCGVGAGAHRSVVPSATSIRCCRNERASSRLDLSFRRGDAPHDARGGPTPSGLVDGASGMGLGITVREYREIETGERWPDGDVGSDLQADGWPQTFVTVL